MQGIDEIKPLISPIQSPCRAAGTFKDHMRQAAKCPQRFRNAARRKSVNPAQHPLGFQQHRGGNKHLLGLDQGFGLRGLLRVIADDEAYDDVSVDHEHDAA